MVASGPGKRTIRTGSSSPTGWPGSSAGRSRFHGRSASPAHRPAAEASARATLEATELLEATPGRPRRSASGLPLLGNLHNLPDGLRQARKLLAPILVGRPETQRRASPTLRAILQGPGLAEAAAGSGSTATRSPIGSGRIEATAAGTCAIRTSPSRWRSPSELCKVNKSPTRSATDSRPILLVRSPSTACRSTSVPNAQGEPFGVPCTPSRPADGVTRTGPPRSRRQHRWWPPCPRERRRPTRPWPRSTRQPPAGSVSSSSSSPTSSATSRP